MIALALLPAALAGDLQLGYNPNPATQREAGLGHHRAPGGG
jgi:hypothetical protein